MGTPSKLLLLLGGLAAGGLAGAADGAATPPGRAGFADGSPWGMWSAPPRSAVVSADRFGAVCPAPPAAAPGETSARRVIRYLADDALEGRLAGSEGERCAAEFLAGEFRRIGLRPAGADGGFFQDVPLASAINPHAPAGTGRNVIARLDGRDPELRDEFVVIVRQQVRLARVQQAVLEPCPVGIVDALDLAAATIFVVL